MIVTVTLNPCLDVTQTIAAFTHGGMNRIQKTRRDIAGKGINVSAALKSLGADSLCAGINYTENGQLIDAYLNERGISYDFVYVDGAVRTNMKIFETDSRIMTEFNQPGGYAPPEAVAALVAKIKAAKASLLILSGSRPQGVDDGIYRRIIEETDAPVLLDTEGTALTKAMEGRRKPFLIKPNLFELENAFGLQFTGKTEIARFAQSLTRRGVSLVCVSMAAEGALLADADGAYFAPALEIPVRGVQGAGDAMVAGMALGLSRHEKTPELLRYAVAAASASVMREGTQMGTLEDFTAMLSRVQVAPI